MANRSPLLWRYRSYLQIEINNVSTHPVTQIKSQLTRFLFGAVRYTAREPAVVIAVINLKGGCGKSTIAVNLACELAANADSVLLVDNDSQGTSSHWLSHGRLPIQGEFMPLENDEDGERRGSGCHANRGGFSSSGARAAAQRRPEMPDRAVKNRPPYGRRTAD